jgi:leader peptidase (prepilin peptidase)/N-methyltransferase
VTPDTGLLLLFTVLGLAVGSFLNVCIYRLPRRESLMRPRSRCTSCGRTLSWFDNVPLISWAAMRGRCRTCGARVSTMYPVVELTTAILFASAYLLYGLSPLLVVRLLFGCVLIVLFVIDLQYQILPNAITVPGIIVGFVCSLVLPPGWRDSLIGIAAGGGVLLLIAEGYYRIRGEEGLGMGDVKMLGMIGAFLGWKLTLLTLIVSSFLGSFIGIGMMVAGSGHMKYALPFGTFLALGAIVAVVGGQPILDWYLSFYR